jgi:hypothetical protein
VLIHYPEHRFVPVASGLSATTLHTANTTWQIVNAPHKSLGYLGYADEDGAFFFEPERA